MFILLLGQTCASIEIKWNQKFFQDNFDINFWFILFVYKFIRQIVSIFVLRIFFITVNVPDK